jgi:hypothetical protein
MRDPCFVSGVRRLALVAVLIGGAAAVPAQSITGSISGTVTDERHETIVATVVARNLDTNISRTIRTDNEGSYHFVSLPVGSYEVRVEAAGFAKYVRAPITVGLNREAIVACVMRPAAVDEVITVRGDARLLNTTNTQLGVQFDSRALSTLPLSPSRDVYNVLLSAPGVTQLGSGQTAFAIGVNFSVNGLGLRSNNFLIDGQDNNDFISAGQGQPINNPDIVQEVRLITNQFAAEYGRNAGSVINAITKSGTNSFHGSLFEFHNNNRFNSRTNLDEAAGLSSSPYRRENQFGGTIGGPILKDHTFFFSSLQRWTDRRTESGFSVDGVPTEEGRQILRAAAGSLPQVSALLAFLPAAQKPLGRSVQITVGGHAFTIPQGSLTASAFRVFNNWQGSARVDHRVNAVHTVTARYLINDSFSSGFGQITPAGFTSVVPSRQQAASLSLRSVISNRLLNEVWVNYQRNETTNSAEHPESQSIPGIEIAQLGLTGAFERDSRTAIGYVPTLPRKRLTNSGQLQDNLSFTSGSHIMKFGSDVRRVQVRSFETQNIRGSLRYSTLQRFIDDVADAATIRKSLPGGQDFTYFLWHDFSFFAQDEWRVKPNFTITYGLRYEIPGNSVASLVDASRRIVQAAGGDLRYALSPVPGRDLNNIQPRFGFNWNPRTGAAGLLGWITGGDKLVVRGGYGRAYDYVADALAITLTNTFPLTRALTLATTAQPSGGVGVSNAFRRLGDPAPPITDPLQLPRSDVGPDLRAPYADHYDLGLQREISKDTVLSVGYVATKGTALLETIDGNPRLPFSTARVDPTHGVIRLRNNAASSIYHSLQVSLDKRFSAGLSAAVHYTWSAAIDEASDFFSPSLNDIGLAQDSFNRRGDRARSNYDRPHRLTGNFVWELPFHASEGGARALLLGGWRMSGVVTLQSGAPFTVLNGTDPTGALSGIDGLVGGSPIRPNINTTLPLSSMSVEDIVRAGGAALFSPLPAGVRVGNAGRNILRADGIGNVDLGISKSIRVHENQSLQLRVDTYNFTNTRNFGIPEGRINSPNFLNQWGTNGGNRRAVVGVRYSF